MIGSTQPGSPRQQAGLPAAQSQGLQAPLAISIQGLSPAQSPSFVHWEQGSFLPGRMAPKRPSFSRPASRGFRGQRASALLQGAGKLFLPRAVVPGRFLFLLRLEEKGPIRFTTIAGPLETLFAPGGGSLAISQEAARLLRTARKAKQKKGGGALLGNPPDGTKQLEELRAHCWDLQPPG